MTVKKGKLMMLALTASLSAAGLWGCRGEAAYLTGGQAQSAEESGTEETAAAGAAVGENVGENAFMEKYLSLRLPDRLYWGNFDRDFEGGCCLLLASDLKDQADLQEKFSYVNSEETPAAWISAGAVIRYDRLAPSFEDGELTGVGNLGNHLWYDSEIIPLPDCEVPAAGILICHDLYTAASIQNLESQNVTLTEEQRVSRMWYVFFARPDSEIVYSISLNAGLFSWEDVYELSKTVHFTEQAWEKGEGDAEKNLESIQVTGSADLSAPAGMVLYRSSPFIWNEEEWSLELYVPEEALADGALMLDDLCCFQIRAVSPDRAYVLFDDSVQLGTPAGDVWTDEEGRLHIVIRDVRTALYRITDFVYDGEQDGFEGQAVIDREGINYWGTVTGQ